MKLNTETYRMPDVTSLIYGFSQVSGHQLPGNNQLLKQESESACQWVKLESYLLLADQHVDVFNVWKKKKKLKKSFIQMTRCLSKQTANSVATVASRQLIRVFAFGKRDATYSSLQLRENASLIKNEINKWGKKKKRKKSFTLGNPRQSLTTSGINDEKKPLLADCVWFYHETTRTCTSAGRAHSRADMNEFA